MSRTDIRILVILVGLVTIAGCTSSSSPEVTAPVSQVQKSSEKAEPPVQLGSKTYPVPEASAVDLMKFMDRMVLEAPVGTTENEQTKDLSDRMVSRVAAADKILGSEERAEFGAFAARLKLESLRVLANIGYEGGTRKFVGYANELAANEDDAYARSGRFGTFQAKVDELMTTPQADGAAVMGNLKQLLRDEPRDRDLFEITREASRYLAAAGLVKEASETSVAISQAFLGHEDEEIVAMANELAAEGHVARLSEIVNEFMVAVEPNGAKLVSDVESVLATSPPVGVLGGIMNTALQIENSGYTDTAEKLYDRLTAPIGKLADEPPAAPEERQMVDVITAGLERAGKRMSLVGKPMEISGRTLDGEPFDWSQYKDKVVLVDFWASWCEPCTEELVNIRENLDRYGEKGLQVVGVNLDDDMEKAKAFLDKEKLPWATVFGESGKLGISANPNAVRCGIETIPFIALVGKDGKVTAIHARGHRLSAALAEVLGAPADEIVLDLDFEDESSDDEAQAADEGEPVEDQSAADEEMKTEQSVETSKEPAARTASPPDDGDSASLDHVQAIGAVLDGNESQSIALVAWQEVAQETEADSKIESVVNLTEEESTRNPYAPEEGMGAKELVNYLLEMQDKSPSIQFRDGFRDGIVMASDQILADGNAKQRFREIAAEAKLDYLHRDACLGDKQADELIFVATKSLADETSAKIKKRLVFHAQERLAIAGSKKKAFDGETYAKLLAYLNEQQKADKDSLAKRHLRMASCMVEMLNLKEDEKQREKDFKELSTILVASSDKQLKRYGRRIGPRESVAAADFIGKPLELTGTTIDGQAFTHAELKGKVVLVDFWATWCGPCRAAMPELQKLYDANQQKGLEIVGVSLDQDLDALREYLKENNLPWVHLAGEDTAKIADKYGVRGIPSMLLVDREGKVLAQGHPSDKSFKAKLVEQLK